MKYVVALALLPSCFLTEYFLVAQWLHVIHVSWWWIVYFISADAGNGFIFRKVLGISLGKTADK